MDEGQEGQEGRTEGVAEPLREVPSARWTQIWASRQLLMKVACRYGCWAEDAEDAVQEAMLRAAEHPEIEALVGQDVLTGV